MSNGMKRLIIIFSICLNVGFLVYTGYALLRPRPATLVERHHPSGSRYSRLLENLDLEPAREAEIKGMVRDFINDMDRLHRRGLTEKLAVLERLAQPGEPDRAWLDPKKRAIQEVEVERERIKFEHMLKIKATLPPDRAELYFKAVSDRIKQRLRPDSSS